MNSFIKQELRKNLIKEGTSEIWYHGTPDVRQLERDGGFSEKTMHIDYVTDPEAFFELQDRMGSARETDEDLYWELLNKVKDFKGEYVMRKPIFLSDSFGVAKTYADARRSIDFQNAEERVLEVEVQTGSSVRIVATGDRFRFIDINKVRRGFIGAGISEEEFNKAVQMFNYMAKDKDGIKTDRVAAIGHWFGFDSVDVVGVLDSYNGGSVKSTVKMVLNPNNLKVKWN